MGLLPNPPTRKLYSNSCNRLLKYLGATKKTLPLTYCDLKDYVQTLSTSLAPLSVKRELRAIQTLYESRGYYDPAILEELDKIIVPKQNKSELTITTEDFCVVMEKLKVEEMRGSHSPLFISRIRAILALVHWEKMNLTNIAKIDASHTIFCPLGLTLRIGQPDATVTTGPYKLVKARDQYCPVEYYKAWTELSKIRTGPAFIRESDIDRGSCAKISAAQLRADIRRSAKICGMKTLWQERDFEKDIFNNWRL
jgi:hypothetical protein